ncbi:MAG: alcohol dehydrogenase catalytic domain-containing protein, partial [Actinomycetota bacterium]
MRALVFHGPLDLRGVVVDDPVITDARDALVRPIAVARCDLDPAIALGLYPMPAPFVMGHEMVGEVVAVGPDVGTVVAGDHVIVPFQLSCTACDPCRRGHTNACTRVAPGPAFGLGAHGGVDLGGALAERVRVPWADVMCLPLPAGLDPVVAAGIPDNVADGYRCVAGPLAERPDAAVVVVGGLAAGVGVCAVVRGGARAAARGVDVERDRPGLEVAVRLGAEIVDAYRLVFAGLVLEFGSFGDRYGRKGVLQIGLVVFAATSGDAALTSAAARL